MDWYVYILRCGDDSLYTGIATDVERRLEEHRSQGPKSARYVRGRLPLKLVYSMKLGTRSEAASEEWRIKQLSKPEKEQLVRRGLAPQ
ncbi:MAG: GIY-YIG nuclease family protein [Puniceicoccaceae bacterium]